MKLRVIKTIENGEFKVAVGASDFTSEEQTQISKFGSPMISIAPKSTTFMNRTTSSLPVHAINNVFNFSIEADADKFVNDITERVKTAMNVLRGKKDQFSGGKEYEL